MLKGKNAIITGGSRGLGAVIAKKFVIEGANVCICSRNEKELSSMAKKLNADKIFSEQIIIFHETDLANINEIDKLFEYACNNMDSLDILVANAGMQKPIGSLDEISWEDWENNIRVNLFGAVYCAKLFVAHWKKFHRGGKIICLSGGGATKARPNFSAYAASKTALVRAMETLAEENKGLNIDINCIAPGAMNTQMLEEALNAGEKNVGSKEFQQLLKQKENGGASLENAAELVAYLASDLSDGISGKLISAVWDDWKNLHLRKNNLSPDIYTLRRITEEK